MPSGSLILLFLMGLNGHPARQCFCGTVPDTEHTRWGNENIVIATVTRLQVLNGVVRDVSHGLMAGALVEVFTDPDLLLLQDNPTIEARRARQRRIAACFTNDDGIFCLTRLPPGRYELRCSAKGFQTVSQQVRVVAKRSARKRVTVELPFAT